jgi:hypothetical protein
MNVDKLIVELSQVKRSKHSLADALNKLDLTLSAMKEISRVKEIQDQIESALHNILERLDSTVTISSLDTLINVRLNEFEIRMNAFLEAFTYKVEDRMDDKVSMEQFKKALSERVSTNAFKNLFENHAETRKRLELSTSSVFEGFKATMKQELALKADTRLVEKLLKKKLDVPIFEVMEKRQDDLENRVMNFESDDEEEEDMDFDVAMIRNFDRANKRS